MASAAISAFVAPLPATGAHRQKDVLLTQSTIVEEKELSLHPSRLGCAGEQYLPPSMCLLGT